MRGRMYHYLFHMYLLTRLNYFLGNNLLPLNPVEFNLNAVKRLLFYVPVMLLLSTTSLYASAAVNLIAYTNYPPYLYHKDNQQSGLYLQIVESTLNAINQPFELETLPFKRAMMKAKEGKGIMIGVLKTNERAQELDFSDSFYQERVSVFFRNFYGPLLTSIDDLDGLTIATILGWSYGEDFDKARKDKRFISIDGKIETNFKLLARDRIEAVIHTELSAIYIIKQLGLTDKITLGSTPLELAEIRIAVKKGTNKALIEKFNLKLKDPDHIKKINNLIKSYREI